MVECRVYPCSPVSCSPVPNVPKPWNIGFIRYGSAAILQILLESYVWCGNIIVCF